MRSLQEHVLHGLVLEEIVFAEESVGLLFDELFECHSVDTRVILLFQGEVVEGVIDVLWASCG